MTGRVVTVELRPGDIRILMEAVENMAVAVAEDDRMGGVENSADAQSLRRLHRAIRMAEHEQVFAHEGDA
jgi:hypothetical protein